MKKRTSDPLDKYRKPVRPMVNYLLGLALSLVLLTVGGIILDSDESSPVGTGVMLIGIFAFLIFLAAIIIRLFRKLTGKIKSLHKFPEEVAYAGIDDSGERTDSPLYKYNVKPENEEDWENSIIPWWAVITALIVFFPIGIFHVIRKTVSEPARYTANGITLIITGTVFCIVSGAMAALMISGTGINAAFAIPSIYFSVGLFCLIYGISLKKKGGIYEKYMSAVTVKKISDMDRISSAVREPYYKVCERIGKLIESGQLPGGYINHRDREVIVPGVSKKVALKCKNCGGTTVLYVNEEKICEFCGAKL